jgi:ribose 5-phosphate isomerase B
MKKLIREADIISLLKSGVKELTVDKNTLLTSLAIDRINSSKMKFTRVEKIEQAKPASNPNGKLFQKIVIGSDHTGFAAKKIMVKFLQEKGYEVIDIGTHKEESCDYPDFAFVASSKVISREACAAILLDATGIPSAIAANKFPGIRAATCYNEFSARSSREHNNANILVMGALSLGIETIKSITGIWLETAFLGDRHQKRLDKISEVERKLLK